MPTHPSQKKTKNLRRLRLSASHLLLLLLLMACSGVDTADLPTPTPLPTPVAVEKPTYTVQRGTVINTLEFTGRVAPVAEQRLFFRSDGFVRNVFVARGDVVQAGDVLAELEIGNLENDLAQARLNLQTAETNLAKAEQANADALAEAGISLETARLRLQRAQAQNVNAAVTSAEIELTRAQEALAFAQEEYQKALDRPWEPDQVRESYARQVTQAERNLTIAQARYNEALATRSTHSFDVQILQQDVTLAGLRLEQLERGVDPLLALEVERSHLAVARLEQRIADARLVAPFDGEILSVGVRPGSFAEAFRVVAVLADPSALEVTAELGATTLSELSAGQPATIRLRNRPGESFDGFVRQLPISGAAAATPQEEDRLTRIALADPEASLEMGELATVVITLEEREDVLWLPPAAIRLFQGRNFVVVQEGDVQRRLDVRLGIESGDRVEILQGVDEGQTVTGP